MTKVNKTISKQTNNETDEIIEEFESIKNDINPFTNLIDEISSELYEYFIYNTKESSFDKKQNTLNDLNNSKESIDSQLISGKKYIEELNMTDNDRQIIIDNLNDMQIMMSKWNCQIENLKNLLSEDKNGIDMKKKEMRKTMKILTDKKDEIERECNLNSSVNLNKSMNDSKLSNLQNSNENESNVNQSNEVKEMKDNSEMKIIQKKQKQQKKKDMLIQPCDLSVIEFFTNTKFKDVLFDSMKDDWRRSNCNLESKLVNKKNILIVIETARKTNSKSQLHQYTISKHHIGAFISSKIEKANQWVSDPNAFVFKIKENEIAKFQIRDKSTAFYLHASRSNEMLEIGRGDILVKKYNDRENSFCKPNSFIYPHNDNLMEGINFVTQRVVILEMKDAQFVNYSIDQQNKQSGHISDRDIRKREKIEEKRRQMQIQTMEKWTGMTFGEMIFDSDKDDWGKNTSIFHERLINRKHVVIEITLDNGIKFGCYVNALIDRVDDYIVDTNAFVYTYKDDNPRKFHCIDFKAKYAFHLPSQNQPELFLCGYYDLWLEKGGKLSCEQSTQSTFNYRGENQLVNAIGRSMFTVKRICAYQMMDGDVMKYIGDNNLVIRNSSIISDELEKRENESDNKNDNNVEKEMKNEINENNEKIDENKNQGDETKMNNSIESRNELDDDLIILDDLNNSNNQNTQNEQSKPTEGFFNKLFTKRKTTQIDPQQNSSTPSTTSPMKTSTNVTENKPIIKERVLSPIKLNESQDLEPPKPSLTKYSDDEESDIIPEHLCRTLSKKDIQKIEALTHVYFAQIIFDTQKDKWGVGTSQFDSIVFNRENLVFVIDDVDGNSIAFYLKSKIHQYKYQENGRWKGGRISDEYAQLIVIENKTMKNVTQESFAMKKECQEMAFRLYKKDFHLLFSIGGNDFNIAKRQMRDKCQFEQHSFDYGDNVLFENKQFEVRRIVVIQMKE